MSQDFFRTPIGSMTANQRARRDRLTRAVIEIVSETGPENLQMREVAERSGVALGTIYRYFTSKEHLLAEAWKDWQGRLTEKVMGDLGRVGRQPTYERVLEFVLREMRAFQHNPNFARLAVQLEACPDPYVSETLVQIGEENQRVMDALMAGLDEDIVRPARIAISSTLGAGLVAWTTGRVTIVEARRNLEEVVRLVLGETD
ncbi:TetR family transcriptional regulator [Actinomadura scrupuli]|uniref:TetR family transcriptional regulator n=1 Tax=Actinomadura scrupuli TaxID=559629 RepID=UPI003D980CAE